MKTDWTKDTWIQSYHYRSGCVFLFRVYFLFSVVFCTSRLLLLFLNNVCCVYACSYFLNTILPLQVRTVLCRDVKTGLVKLYSFISVRTCSRVAANPWRSATYGKPWTSPTFSVIWLVMSVRVSGFTVGNQHICNLFLPPLSVGVWLRSVMYLWCRCRRSTPGRSGRLRSLASGCWSWGWCPLSSPLTDHKTKQTVNPYAKICYVKVCILPSIVWFETDCTVFMRI